MNGIFPHINHNSQSLASFRMTPSKDPSKESSIVPSRGKVSFVDSWKAQRLPPINQSNQDQFVKSSSIKISKNQESVSNKFSEDIEDETPQSRIYFRYVFNESKLYLLKFNMCEVEVKPLYLAQRVFEERDNDKCIQPRSETVFRHRYNLKAQRLSILFRKFQLNKNNDRISVMSSKKPLMKPKKSAPDPLKSRPPISSKKSSIGKSIIFINYKKLNMELYPGVIDIRQIKPIDYAKQGEQEKLLADLGMESTKLKTNRANFIVKHKKDILKVTFALTNTIFEIVNEKVSRGIQVKDDSAYVSGFSAVTDRGVNMPIPKSTYTYIDPMVEVRRKNVIIKLSNMEPHWMRKTRMKRIHEYRRCRVFDPYKNLQEMVVGSTIAFEGSNCIYKSSTGTIPCEADNLQYEAWVVSHQKIDYSAMTNDPDKNESHPRGDVPDWDLLLHNV